MKLLTELSGVIKETRTARFRCVIAIDWNDGNIQTVEGVVEGLIAENVAEGGGFGYDPLFIHPPSGKRFSEMSVDEKNRVSHRGLALQKARDLFIERVNRGSC